MESYVKALYDRLNENDKMRLIMITDNAINEMHNNGIISKLPPEAQAKLHNSDPEIRVSEKTSLAKSVGYSFVVSSEPCIFEGETAYKIVIKNDIRFPNSIAICVQGGLEGLYASGIYKKNPSGKIRYSIAISENGQDASELIKNLNILGEMYPAFDIKISNDLETNTSNQTQQSQKKKGFLSKIFRKR